LGEVRSKVSKFCYVQIVVAGRNGEGNYYLLKTQNMQHTDVFHILYDEHIKSNETKLI